MTLVRFALPCCTDYASLSLQVCTRAAPHSVVGRVCPGEMDVPLLDERPQCKYGPPWLFVDQHAVYSRLSAFVAVTLENVRCPSSYCHAVCMVAVGRWACNVAACVVGVVRYVYHAAVPHDECLWRPHADGHARCCPHCMREMCPPCQFTNLIRKLPWCRHPGGACLCRKKSSRGKQTWQPTTELCLGHFAASRPHHATLHC